MAKLKEKEECAECRRLRKMLQNADKQEKLLSKGIHNLIMEIRKLTGKEPRDYQRRYLKGKA